MRPRGAKERRGKRTRNGKPLGRRTFSTQREDARDEDGILSYLFNYIAMISFTYQRKRRGAKREGTRAAATDVILVGYELG